MSTYESATGNSITSFSQAKNLFQDARMHTAKVRPTSGNPVRVAEHGTSIPLCPTGCDVLLQGLGKLFE